MRVKSAVFLVTDLRHVTFRFLSFFFIFTEMFVLTAWRLSEVVCERVLVGWCWRVEIYWTQVRDLNMYQLPEAGKALPQTVVYSRQSGLQARSLKPSSWQTQFLLEDLRRS